MAMFMYEIEPTKPAAMKPTALFLSSGDVLADRRYERAKAYAADGDHAAAADLLAQALERAPDFASAWFALGEIRAQSGDRAGAVAAFRAALAADPSDRHGAALQLARLGVGGRRAGGSARRRAAPARARPRRSVPRSPPIPATATARRCSSRGSAWAI